MSIYSRALFNSSRFVISAQVPCGYARAGGQPCAASVRLEQMAAHYEVAHGASIYAGLCNAKILDDGSKIVQHTQTHSFPNNSAGWFVYSGLIPAVFRTAFGGCFALDLQCIGASELRFGVRQLGRGPPRHRLASVKVSFGPADGMCVQYPLSRALAADERLGDDALCAGTPPAVGRVDPALLAPTLVLWPGTPVPGKPWELVVTATLVFGAARET